MDKQNYINNIHKVSKYLQKYVNNNNDFYLQKINHYIEKTYANQHGGTMADVQLLTGELIATVTQVIDEHLALTRQLKSMNYIDNSLIVQAILIDPSTQKKFVVNDNVTPNELLKHPLTETDAAAILDKISTLFHLSGMAEPPILNKPRQQNSVVVTYVNFNKDVDIQTILQEFNMNESAVIKLDGANQKTYRLYAIRQPLLSRHPAYNQENEVAKSKFNREATAAFIASITPNIVKKSKKSIITEEEKQELLKKQREQFPFGASFVVQAILIDPLTGKRHVNADGTLLRIEFLKYPLTDIDINNVERNILPKIAQYFSEFIASIVMNSAEQHTQDIPLNIYVTCNQGANMPDYLQGFNNDNTLVIKLSNNNTYRFFAMYQTQKANTTGYDKVTEDKKIEANKETREAFIASITHVVPSIKSVKAAVPPLASPVPIPVVNPIGSVGRRIPFIKPVQKVVPPRTVTNIASSDASGDPSIKPARTEFADLSPEDIAKLSAFSPEDIATRISTLSASKYGQIFKQYEIDGKKLISFKTIDELITILATAIRDSNYDTRFIKVIRNLWLLKNNPNLEDETFINESFTPEKHTLVNKENEFYINKLKKSNA